MIVRRNLFNETSASPERTDTGHNFFPLCFTQNLGGESLILALQHKLTVEVSHDGAITCFPSPNCITVQFYRDHLASHALHEPRLDLKK